MLHVDSRETTFEHQGMPVARFNIFLSPNIHIQILQTDLHTFPWRISWENLVKDQIFFSLWSLFLSILIDFALDSLWISLGEKWFLALLGLEGLKLFDRHATYCYIQVDLKSFLASGAFFLGREATKRATTS